MLIWLRQVRSHRAYFVHLFIVDDRVVRLAKVAALRLVHSLVHGVLVTLGFFSGLVLFVVALLTGKLISLDLFNI